MTNTKTSNNIWINEWKTVEVLTSANFFDYPKEVLRVVSETCLANDNCFSKRASDTELLYSSESNDIHFFEKLVLELLKYWITNNSNTSFTDNESLLSDLREWDFSIVEELLLSKKDEIFKSHDSEYISKLLIEINSITFWFTHALSVVSMDPMKNEQINKGVRNLKYYLSTIKKDINIRKNADYINDNKINFWKLPINELLEELFLSVDYLSVVYNSELDVNWIMPKSGITKKHNRKQDNIWRFFTKILGLIQLQRENELQWKWKVSEELEFLYNQFNKESPYLRTKLDLQFNQFQQEAYFETSCKQDKLQYNITELKNNHNSRFHNLIHCYYELAGIEYDHKSITRDESDVENKDVLSKENIQWILEHFLLELSRGNQDIKLYFNIVDAIMYYSDCINEEIIVNFQRNINKQLNKDNNWKYKHWDLNLFLSSSKGLYKYKARFLQEEKDSKIDTLTGLSNVKAYNLEIIEALRKSLRSNEYQWLMMLDLDKFKNINDTYGHIYGDVVLSTLAQVLNENTRIWYDKIYRIWWEEFVIIFETKNEKEAELFAEKIRKSIEKNVLEKINKEEWEYVLKTTAITASIWLSQVSVSWISNPEKLQDKELLDKALIIKEKADKALYFSKNNWRNKITFYSKELDK